MNTTFLGAQAEKLVSDHLRVQGYKILDRNWRRQTCEIDIVAKKSEIVFFVEVKFRRHSNQGPGLDHITPAKLTRMRQAALVWSHESGWSGDCRLMAAAVDYDGQSMNLNEIVEVD
jgi:putative endonuclease